jgi:hypothetical protein
MPSPPEQAALNLKEARILRASGLPYRKIRQQLDLSPGQLGHIRRALKREKASRTRLGKRQRGATDHDLPVAQSALPKGLRKILTGSGYETLGDLAERLADTELPGFEAMSGIGPHRARLIKGLLDDFGLLPGSDDLQSEIEKLFPELRAEANPND